MEKLRAIEREGLKDKLPAFDPGDTVRVMVRVREGRERASPGVRGRLHRAPRRRHQRDLHRAQDFGGRRAWSGSSRCTRPSIAEIELVRKGRVRRAKLYFLRRLAGKAARIREKRGAATTGAGAEPGRRAPRREQPPPHVRARIGALERGAEHRRRSRRGGPRPTGRTGGGRGRRVSGGSEADPRAARLQAAARRCKRERLALLVRARAIAVGVGAASVREIDRLNIRRATILAMQRALARLGADAARHPRRRPPAARAGMSARRDRGRRRVMPVDRRGLGHRQDGARRPDAAPRRPLSRLRLGREQRLRHPRAPGRAAGARPHPPSPAELRAGAPSCRSSSPSPLQPLPELRERARIEDVARLEPGTPRQIHGVAHEREIAGVVAVGREHEAHARAPSPPPPACRGGPSARGGR